MTKKERKKLYLKTAEMIGNVPGHPYWITCPTMAYVLYGRNEYEKITEELVPEFHLFKPNSTLGAQSYWFSGALETDGAEKFYAAQDVRITALLLAAEMCN